MPQQDTFYETARGRFFVRDTGGAFPPLVMLHGWPESSYCWEPLMPLLSSAFRLIRPDLRGMGDSERTLDRKAYLKTELAQDMLALLQKMEVDTFGLVGHDWGGVVAQEMALAAPERIRALALLNIIVINNAPGMAAAMERLKKYGATISWYQTFQQQDHLAEAMIPGNEEVWLSHFLRLAKKKPFPLDAKQEYIRTFKIPGTATTSANYYRTQYEDMQRWRTLPGQKFKMPGLYLHGQRDIVIIPEYHLGFADCFEAEARVISLDEGHFIQEEDPQGVAQALGGFFGKYALG